LLALTAMAVTAGLVCSAEMAAAQTVREVFEKVAPSVVVIKARGRDLTTAGQSRFKETGSGVLVTRDGKVMTAAHVVHSMDQIDVEFLGGETVSARVIASELSRSRCRARQGAGEGAVATMGTSTPCVGDR
jgi:serine protease Do